MTDTIQKIADEMATYQAPSNGQYIQVHPRVMRDWEARLRALAARASAGEGGDAAAWMIRNIHTGRFYWDEEECVFSDSSSAELYAEYLNDAYDSDPWEVVPLYTAAPQPAPSENES